MTLTTTITDIIIQTLANIISNLAWIILFIWGIRFIGKNIGEGIKKVPEWIESYHKRQLERIRIESAISRRNM